MRLIDCRPKPQSLDKISRSEERGYAATERKASQELYRDYTAERNRYKKPLN